MNSLRANFNRLNNLRYQQDNLWRQFPLIGFIARTLRRLRYWGEMRSIEMQILNELISQAEASIIQNSMSANATTELTTRLEQLSAAISDEYEHPLQQLDNKGLRFNEPQQEATASVFTQRVYYIEFTVNDKVRYQIAVQDKAMPDGSEDIVIAGLKSGNSMIGSAQSFVLNLATPGWRIIDAGAHVGVFSLPAAALGCQVVAIEGSMLNAYLQGLSIQRNQFRNLSVLNAAASNEDGFATFTAWGAWGRLGQMNLPHASIVPSLIQTVSIDTLVSKLDWESVDAVKIDVEGSEAEVLDGMKNLLARPDAPIVIFESNSIILKERGQTPADLISLLQRYGYKCYLPSYGTLQALAPDHLQIQPFVDYVAIKSSHSLDTLLASINWRLLPSRGQSQILDEIDKELQAAPSLMEKQWLLQSLQGFTNELRSDPRVMAAEKKLIDEISAGSR